MSSTNTRMSSEAETSLAEGFAAVRTALAGNAAISTARDEAFGRFSARGLPTPRNESWHYSDLRSAMSVAFPQAPSPDSAALDAAGTALSGLALTGDTIVIVDGTYVAALGSIAQTPEISVRSLADALASADERFVGDLTGQGIDSQDSALSLNAALMTDGAVIDIPDGVALDVPLNIVSIATRTAPSAQFTRCIVRAGRGAAATIVEHYASTGDAEAQVNSALVIAVADDANVQHIFASDRQGAGLVHVNSLLVTVGAAARFKSFGLLDHGAFVRRQIFSRFDGADASLELAGLVLVRGRDHMDTTLVVEHRHPDCRSSEYFKHIVEGAGTGVFQGKIAVAAQAQKTDGAMKSQAILLSDDAAMYNKPELEIFADDVACGHGATCGSLDEDQLFYTMARGIPRVQAEALLLEAFGADAIGGVEDEVLKEALVERLRDWLAGRQS